MNSQCTLIHSNRSLLALLCYCTPDCSFGSQLSLCVCKRMRVASASGDRVAFCKLEQSDLVCVVDARRIALKRSVDVDSSDLYPWSFWFTYLIFVAIVISISTQIIFLNKSLSAYNVNLVRALCLWPRRAVPCSCCHVLTQRNMQALACCSLYSTRTVRGLARTRI